MQHPPLSYAFVKEQINRINKGFCVQHDTYKPNIKEIPVTTKFWAKHESGLVKAGQEGQHATYMKMVEEDLMHGPKHKYDRPIVESHKYDNKILYLSVCVCNNHKLFANIYL